MPREKADAEKTRRLVVAEGRRDCLLCYSDVGDEAFCTNAAFRHMHEGNRIICTTGVTGYKGNESLLDYGSSTNGARVAFVRSLDQPLAERKILVNGVAPGPVLTPLIVSSFEGDRLKSFDVSTTLGLPGIPEELGPAYVFLASHDSSFVTGQVIQVNGGSVVTG